MEKIVESDFPIRFTSKSASSEPLLGASIPRIVTVFRVRSFSCSDSLPSHPLMKLSYSVDIPYFSIFGKLGFLS